MALASGTATAGRISPHSVAVTATAATGGTAPYNYQWQVRWPRGSAVWDSATGAGVTALAPTVENLGPAAAYQIRLQYTDHAAAVVTSNVLSVRTLGARWQSMH